MTTQKSQNELEQPAKVYQLMAVETKMDQALDKLNKITDQTAGLVTTTQLETSNKLNKKYVDDEMRAVKGDIKSLKNYVKAFIAALIGGIALQLIQTLKLFGTG